MNAKKHSWQPWQEITPSRGWWWMMEPDWKEPLVILMARFRGEPWQMMTLSGPIKALPQSRFLKCDVPPFPGSEAQPPQPEGRSRTDIADEEATRDPIFLLQARRIICTNQDRYDYDSDLEALRDEQGREVTNQELLDREDAVEVWETQSVWLTREDAEQHGARTAYHYPDGWRVYCLCAEGELATLLNGVDESQARLEALLKAADDVCSSWFWCREHREFGLLGSHQVMHLQDAYRAYCGEAEGGPYAHEN